MPLNPGDVALRIPERLIVTLSSVFEDDTVAVRCASIGDHSTPGGNRRIPAEDHLQPCGLIEVLQSASMLCLSAVLSLRAGATHVQQAQRTCVPHAVHDVREAAREGEPLVRCHALTQMSAQV